MSTTFVPAEVYAGRTGTRAAGGQDVAYTEPSSVRRIASLDIIRGAVMVLMAIDHVRVYAGVPAGGPSFGVFFTRWVTHFCAPAFIFLAGTAPTDALITGTLIVAASCVFCAVLVLALPSVERNAA